MPPMPPMLKITPMSMSVAPISLASTITMRGVAAPTRFMPPVRNAM